MILRFLLAINSVWPLPFLFLLASFTTLRTEESGRGNFHTKHINPRPETDLTTTVVCWCKLDVGERKNELL